MPTSHVHGRKDFFPERYPGETAGQIVAAWLNKHRGKRDPLRRLLEASQEFRASGLAPLEAGRKVDDTLGEIVRTSHLAVAPLVVEATATRWRVDWRPVGRMKPARALAFFKLLQLAETGLVDRVRQCAKPGCGRWFFARYRHQRFDCKKCQLEDFRSSPEWKQKRREYMRNLRLKGKP
jgi:predicted RNA-binding Zn ribbon-like protein